MQASVNNICALLRKAAPTNLTQSERLAITRSRQNAKAYLVARRAIYELCAHGAYDSLLRTGTSLEKFCDHFFDTGLTEVQRLLKVHQYEIQLNRFVPKFPETVAHGRKASFFGLKRTAKLQLVTNGIYDLVKKVLGLALVVLAAYLLGRLGNRQVQGRSLPAAVTYSGTHT